MNDIEVGYESPSQFSREYARPFSAPPKRDVVIIRTKVAPTQSRVPRDSLIAARSIVTGTRLPGTLTIGRAEARAARSAL